MSGAVPLPPYLARLVDGGLAVLNRDYPAWRFTKFTRSDGRFGGWWAIRRTPITPTERAVGLVGSVGRGDLVALVMEITVQDELARLAGYATGKPEEGS